MLNLLQSIADAALIGPRRKYRNVRLWHTRCRISRTDNSKHAGTQVLMAEFCFCVALAFVNFELSSARFPMLLLPPRKTDLCKIHHC